MRELRTRIRLVFAARSSLIHERATELLDCTIKFNEGNSALNRTATGKPVAGSYLDR
jgi:hypothetical protein